MNQIVLFEKKSNCCGCGACMNVCPKSAITMQEDEYGFLYPQIDYNLCVSCGACKKACGYQNVEEVRSHPEETYVALSKDNAQLKNSASGGVFSAIAGQFIQTGGIVYGCAMEYANEELYPKHIRVDRADKLIELQGSKYVQSDIGSCYKRVKEDLKSRCSVLFSGTPCQVGGLYSFLGGRNKWDNLYTIDIICHGVPNARLFHGYIELLEKKIDGKIKQFYFRDKSKGWGLIAKAVYEDANGNMKSKRIHSKLSSYYSLFLDSLTYRENCYSCKYAGAERIGDLTIGDFWGIEKEHPDYLIDNGGELNEKNGISCALVNSDKGNMLIEQYAEKLHVKGSSLEKAARRNGQLNRPSEMKPERNTILNLFRDKEYSAVDTWYYKQLGKKKYIYMVWDMMPRKLQLTAKKVLHVG